jgi:hypothetical protein
MNCGQSSLGGGLATLNLPPGHLHVTVATGHACSVNSKRRPSVTSAVSCCGFSVKRKALGWGDAAAPAAVADIQLRGTAAAAELTRSPSGSLYTWHCHQRICRAGTLQQHKRRKASRLGLRLKRETSAALAAGSWHAFVLSVSCDPVQLHALGSCCSCCQLDIAGSCDACPCCCCSSLWLPGWQNAYTCCSCGVLCPYGAAVSATVTTHRRCHQPC